jgi:hypothetical protein
MKRVCISVAAALCLAALSAKASAQTTYTWTALGNNDWQVATNWSPARTAPADSDVIVIDGLVTPGPTIINIPAEKIGRLRIVNNVSGGPNSGATLSASTLQPGAKTLTVGGGAGVDFEIDSGSRLILSGSTGLQISLAQAATASLAGSVVVEGGPHKLTALAAGAVTFENGATFTTAAGFSGNAFGDAAANANSVVFAGGSSYFHSAGSNPFGLAAPASAVVFQPASLASYQSSAGFSSSGRIYGSLTLGGGATYSHAGANALTVVNNLTVAAGSMLNHTNTSAAGISIAGAAVINGALACGPASVVSGGGSFALAPGASLSVASAAGITPSGAAGNIQVTGARSFSSAASYTYNGTAAQVTGGGLPVSVINLTINNGAGVMLSASVTVSGVLTLTAGDLKTGPNSLTQSGTSAGTGDVIGNVRRTDLGPAPRQFGNPFNSITVNSGTAPAEITVNLSRSTPGDFTNAVMRTYVITPASGSGFFATLRLHYLAAELNANAEAGLELWRRDGTTWNKRGRTGAVNTANKWVELSGVTAFSPWTLSSASPTEVELVRFDAISFDDGRVLLEWQTGYEVDNLGFNLYREQAGERTLITRELIAGSALVAGPGTLLSAGRSYRWTDRPPGGSKSARYWLEEISLDGRSVWHAPDTFGREAGSDGSSPEESPPSRALSALAAEPARSPSSLSSHSGTPVERKARLRRHGPERAALQAALASQAAIKFYVKHEGWYRVTQPELLAAGLSPSADPRLLQLFVDGREQPIRVAGEKDGRFDAADAVEFYGIGLDAPSTDARAYWLVAGSLPGRRIAAPQGRGVFAKAASFRYTVERKDRRIYFAALKNGDKENFFGPVVTASAVEQTISLRNIDAAQDMATLEVALQGVTQAEHRVGVAINGTAAGEIAFTGQAHNVARLAVAQSLLESGENVIRLTAAGGAQDTSLIDYIRVTYWHLLAADQNALRFTAPGKHAITVDGFTTRRLRVLDITSPNEVLELAANVSAHKGGFAVTAASPAAGERLFLAFAESEIKRPASVTADRPSSLRHAGQGADFVIITRGSLAAALEPLRRLREQQGLKVVVADVEDIYDEFSFGHKSPQAIKDFLSFARSSWQKAPRFVMLAGDATLDPRDYLGQGDFDLVPTRLVETALLETASDDWLADFDADAVPEMAVGRLPARTAEELSVMVGKITGYDAEAGAGELLLVADRNDGFDFKALNGRLRALVPEHVLVSEIDRAAAGTAAAKAALAEAIIRGQKIVNYAGHGSSDLWRDGLLTAAAAKGLTNPGRLPMFVAMTCLNGFFHDTHIESLAEALMKAEQGGAVAVWASSSMTMASGQAAMNQELYRWLFAAPPATVGEAAAKAKAAVGDLDVRRSWILFGDPTTRLR